ncbi:sugar kinase [Tuwongella immobilis]|uniref:Carbohydrate kinase PfkB domain-containing protein n=1 Tax=Tuwongella immobilis TaxID=692036 RepID=A0A6C2YLA4_9BACT|nr:sugar kinase [Tuwongella immobilis]VIP01885.1 2-dehydro-3-deoxygluconokinase : Ribokinase-like domain-containing protein OS=uncultured organism GN=FLSS-18_0020 PE=4 SV=1: PfkB [Tuwongella immobilis]VTR99743.1 2-dehydro-3-deoxygluconokinase : Ribokinase-like domain-containing protein OS=uncultured organism GN=FLSS-18_0020 PE=4 SV=1: PfkB [Tuwongella immobilis]
MARILTFGEAMLRLTPPDFLRLEQAHALNLHAGGAELNTSVGLARLGHDVSWVSRLPGHALGRLVANRAREAGVRTDAVQFVPENDPQARVGLYFLEFGAAPRPSALVYDRKDSAIARITPGSVPWESLMANADWFHVTGITPALSAATAAVTREAMQTAKRMGLRISFDPNYRSTLWSIDEAKPWMREAVEMADVVTTSMEDATVFLDIPPGEPEVVLQQVAERYQVQAVAMSLRENVSVWKNRFTAIAVANGTVYRTRSYEVEIVDRIGAGDALIAGFIDGVLAGDIQRGLDWGTAMGAVKHSIPGDFPWITPHEIQSIVAEGGYRIRR